MPTGTETEAGQQSVEEKKKAAALEASKKTSETKQEKSDKKDEALQPPVSPAAPLVPHPSIEADSLPAPEHTSKAPGREGCVIVTVTDPDGQPVRGARVAVIDQPEGGHSTFFNGRTGERGRWHDCGFTTGHRIRIAVMGPRGGVLGTQQALVAQGRNFVDIRIQRKIANAPAFGPKQRRLFPRQ